MSRKSSKIEPYLPYKEFVNHLKLQASDNVYLVSDISRLMMNAVQHGEKFEPNELISSFTEFLSEGSLFIPGFVNTLSNNATVDMRNLKPETGGLSKEAFLQYKKGNCIRSNDPFHSFFIYGKNGEKISHSTIDNVDTFGENSVFGYLHRNNGILLMLDLKLYYGFTFAHYVEQQLKVSYRKTQPYHFNFTDTNGLTSQKTFNIYAKKRGYNPVLNSLENPLIEAGALEIIRFNDTNTYRIDLKKAFEVIKDDIKKNKARNLIDFKLSLYLKQLIKNITG